MSGDLSRSEREALAFVKWYVYVMGGLGLLGVLAFAFWEFFGAMFR